MNGRCFFLFMFFCFFKQKTAYEMRISDWSSDVCSSDLRGVVIPAHPLALDAYRQFDRRRQRALTRYYVDCGVGGLAVGVHTTQFAIREAIGRASCRERVCRYG